MPAHIGERCEDSMCGDWRRFIKDISENILNLKCPFPQCKAVFLEWTGCCAVTCESCKGDFCGFCFSPERNSSVCHAHVLKCKLNPKKNEYFCSREELDKVHNRMKLTQLRQYFATQVPKGDIKRKVLRECEKLLAGTQISIQDVV